MPGTYSSDHEEDLNFEEISDTKMGETSVKYCNKTYLILGLGSTATVYPGYHFGIKKPAAVKHIRNRHLRTNHDAMKELEIWSKIDQNQNIIRLYDSYQDPREGMFLAMEKAERTFKEQIINFDNGEDEILIWLHQVSKAVEYLHGMGVAHRDIDPENILMVVHENKLVAKLSDFGVSLMLNIEVKENQGSNFMMDIYMLGKLIYFGLSKGMIIESYTPVDYLKSGNLAAHYLLRSMMEREPNNRADISEVLSHCLFWNLEQVKKFLLNVAICLSKRDCGVTISVKKKIDSAYKNYFERKNPDKRFNWIEIARENYMNIIELLSPNTQTKEYGTGESVTRFIKLIRDKLVHHPELRPPAVKLFSDGDGIFREEIFVKKLTSMFPGLTAVLYQVLSQNVDLYPLRSLCVVYFEEKLKNVSRDEQGENILRLRMSDKKDLCTSDDEADG